MSKHEQYRQQLKAEFDQLFNTLGLKDHQRQYLRGRWMDQVLWMEARASKARDWYYRLRLTTIIGGVTIPILVSLNLPDNQRNISNAIRYITIGLGGVVAISSAVEEFFHYGERWRHYRRSVESLKAQGWQFSQLTGPYSTFTNHTDAFSVFSMQVEEILQRDVEVYATQVINEKLAKKENQQGGTSADYASSGDTESYYPPSSGTLEAPVTTSTGGFGVSEYGTSTSPEVASAYGSEAPVMGDISATDNNPGAYTNFPDTP